MADGKALIGSEAEQLRGLGVIPRDTLAIMIEGSLVFAGASETVALAMFQRIQARHADLLGGLTPLVIRKRNPGMGLRPIANVRIGAASRAEAERFCAKLLAKQIACVVRRN